MSEAIELLKSINASLETIVAFIKRQASQSQRRTEVASDADLNSQYGDPEIKAKDPRDWTGPSMKGRRFSECPPEYLDLLAERLDYFADQAEAEGKTTSSGKPVAPYNRKDAARARGWAARIRSGRHVQADSTADNWPTDGAPSPVEEDIPF